MKRLLSFALGLTVAGLAEAQVVLDNFNSGTATGSTSASVLGYTSSWVGQVTQNSTSITVGGSAKDDNGWGAKNQNISTTGMNFVTVIAQRDATNAGTSFSISFSDGVDTQVVSVLASSFAVGSMTTVSIPVTWSLTGNITDWNMGGGQPSPGINSYLMTFDNLSLTATAIPEPSTYAAIFGVACLGLAIFRKQRRKEAISTE